MNFAIVLAAGVGQRMRNGGLPKQFLKLMGKPIVIYTLEKFEESAEIDGVVVVCHGSYIKHMTELLSLYRIKKVKKVIVGGSDRQGSLRRGRGANVGVVQDYVYISLLYHLSLTFTVQRHTYFLPIPVSLSRNNNLPGTSSSPSNGKKSCIISSMRPARPAHRILQTVLWILCGGMCGGPVAPVTNTVLFLKHSQSMGLFRIMSISLCSTIFPSHLQSKD